MIARLQTGALAALLSVLALAGIPRAAAAQSKADAFAGRIPPVSGQLFQKAGRLELTAGGDLSLNDAFFTKYFGGVELGYHLSESWAFSAHAAGGLAARSGSAVVCTTGTGCSNATDTMLRQVPGRIRGLASAGLSWAPVYGKLNVLAEKVAHFDLSLLAGVDLVAHDEVLSKADAEALALGGGSPKLKTSTGFHVGVGARLFISQAIAARLVLKDVVYAVKVPNNGAASDWQNQLFTEIGLSFFFPTHNRVQR
ncbi:MAG TPA: outer membrane beta-barrel domain-containing protein [Anaeromyxobacter sp.]